MKEQFPESPSHPQHRSEVAADQEEEGHAKAMNSMVGGLVEGMLVNVLCWPVGIREIGEKPMHHDAEEHGAGPQGIEVVVAGSIAHGDILFREEEGEQGWSSESFEGWVVAGVP